MKFKNILALAATCLAITACSPDVGSEKWCEQMKEKPRGEWTMDETGDFTKHCIFR